MIASRLWAIFALTIIVMVAVVSANTCTDTCDTLHTTGIAIAFCGTDGTDHNSHIDAISCYVNTCGVNVAQPGTCACPNDCYASHGYGTCITAVNATTKSCSCIDTRDGPDCSLVGCPANTCSGHGSCIQEFAFPDRCKCQVGWTGVDCSVVEPNLYHAPYGEIFSEYVYLNDSYGDAHPLFNLSHMARLYISVEESDLAYLLSPANVWNQTWVDSVFTYENGVQEANLAGVSMQLNPGASRTSIKKDWTFDFALTTPGQSLLGVESVVLKGAEGGDALLREQLYNDMLRAASVPAQRTSFAQVWINHVYQGLYLIQEQIDDAFAISRFNDLDGDLYKLNGPVYLGYPSTDHTWYENATATQGSWTYHVYEKTQGTGDFSDLVDFLSTIYSGNEGQVANIFNIDQFLRQAAVEAFLLASDSFVTSGQNYFLYRTQRYATHMWQMIPHDFDKIMSVGQAHDIYAYIKTKWASSPLIQRIFTIPAFNQTFIDHFRVLMADTFGSDRIVGVVSPVERYTRLLNFTAPMMADDKLWLMSNGLTDSSSYRTAAEVIIAALPGRAADVINQLGAAPSCAAACDARSIDGIFITFCGTDGITHTTHMSATGDCYLACGISIQYPGICGCPNDCYASKSQGTCVTSNTTGVSSCVCKDDRDGDDCSLVGCPANTCSGHGTCVVSSFSADYCRCNNGWTGNDCEVAQTGIMAAPYGTIFDTVTSIYLNDTYHDAHPLFNLSHMARIYIAVDPTDLAMLLNPVNMWNQSWVNTVVFIENGLENTATADVAFKLNEGYSRRALKKDWTLDFSVYTTGQNLMGVESLVLKGAEGGDALLREQLYNDMLRAAGVPAQRAAWSQVWINGIYQGLYLMQEQIDDAFAVSRYNDIDGDLYKMNGVVDLNVPSSDPAYYKNLVSTDGGWTYHPYEKTQGSGDYSDLVAFLAILNNATDADFVTKFSAVFDIDTWIRQAVVETFLLAQDSFLSASTNYFLYRHQSSPIAGKWSMIPHDFDQVLSTSAPTKIYDLLRTRQTTSPLVARLIQISSFNTTFQSYMRTFVNKIFGSERNSLVKSPSVRYQQMFNFTWTMIQEDRFWLLSNGVTDYSDYQSGANQVITMLPVRTSQVQAQINEWYPSDSNGLSTAAKWGIGIAVVVVLGVVMYCCWSRSRQSQYTDATQRLGGHDETEPIGFGNSGKGKTYGGSSADNTYQSGGNSRA